MHKLLLILALISPLAARASGDDIFHGTAFCEGRSGTVSVTLSFAVTAQGNTAHFTYVNSKSPSRPWEFDMDPRDMIATLGWQYANLAHGHHNTIVKLMADGDIFGRPTRDDSSAAPFLGKLYVQTGNDSPSKELFKVTCRNKLLEE